MLLAVLTAVAAGALVIAAPGVGLNQQLSADRIVAATVATALLALTFAAIAFSVGAATGHGSLAIASAATGFILEGLAAQGRALRPIRALSP